MEKSTELTTRLKQLVDQRIDFEKDLQNKSELGERERAKYDRSYDTLQRELFHLFRQTTDEDQRITVMLEIIRILENKLVYLQNFNVDPTTDTRMLASLVDRFIDHLGTSRSTVLTNLEATYYRAIVALYAGDVQTARNGFRAACESEESDEANDIKFKSYVILGNLSHEEKDYATARDLHDQAMRYSQQNNVTAQALAFKALNSYALQEYDEALHLFEDALQLFDPAQPYFNSYFYRNSLLFCGLIYFERKEYAKAEEFYRRIIQYVERDSYDYFDALVRLGKIQYISHRYDEAAHSFDSAIQTHRFSENEYLVDTWFWLAKTHLRQNRVGDAKPLLEKIAASEVQYEWKKQAVELLQKV